MAQSTQSFLGYFWRLAGPYWWSEERWAGRGLLAVVVALNLAQVYVSVLFNQWNNRFYNALQELDEAAAFHELLVFAGLAAAFIAIAVYRIYLNQMLQIRWRRWLTHRFLREWLKDSAYYRLQTVWKGTDNPDQRISEDIQQFVATTLSLSLGLLSSAVTLISFIVILWDLSGSAPLPIPGIGTIVIPGYMCWAALIYAALGTCLAHYIGRPLVKLNFDQQRFEADFRFRLVRLRENAEGVALYRGEASEEASLSNAFTYVVGNFRQIMSRQKRLTWFTAGYNQVAIIFPFVVAMPRYFAKEIQLGGLMQVASAFGEVQGAVSFIVNSYTTIADWRAVVNRLTGFLQTLDEIEEAARHPGITVTRASDGKPAEIGLEDLQIQLPDGRPLVSDLRFRFAAGESVLITGPTGSGKSSLMRSIAGIWPFGRGKITVPAGQRLLFLPQKPYLPLGTLRSALLFPGGLEADDDALREVLQACGLERFAGALERSENWGQILSGGEQQRLAVARALLHRPDWLFLDEATSAMEESAEAEIYRLLRQRLAHTALVSVGHRSTLRAFHARELAFANGGGRLVEQAAQ
ncbi:MAG: ABC transporter ATP-binding protein/permease [Proteobacteria bacterium]|nr:ABC transporter ATP-binding protein/permease [Pseudomonadota bacterium]MBI3496861.1 ABC transporter ATP-binding protein/permease [Pseudomonadota bacterium]